MSTSDTEIKHDALAHQVASQTDHTSQYLSFMLGAEVYGIDILRVQEIRGWEKTTKLPGVPSYVKGVINMRGAVVPIIDMRERFGINNAPTYDDTTVVIITKFLVEESNRTIDKTVGLVVDGVSDVEDIDSETIQIAPKFTNQTDQRIDEAFIKGLSVVDQDDEQHMLIILNVDSLISQGVFNQLEH